MSATVVLGPGTLTLGTAPTDFSCEVMGGQITHEYNTVGEARTPLCGTEKPAAETRSDGAQFSIENDLSAAGLYKYLIDNDLRSVAFAYTPNTVHGAKWAGTVVAKLPGSIGADSFGSPIVSEVVLPGVGTFTFTPGTNPTAAEAPAE
jgi:hypothetical protein